MLKTESTAVVIVDIQEKLAVAIHEKEQLIENARKLIQGVLVLGVPALASEQYPKGLGPTVPAIAELIGAARVEKLSFGCCGEPAFIQRLKEMKRRQILLAGMESHVCVYQTAAGLIERGYEVHVVADAVSSRTPQNRQIGIDRMRECGAIVTSVEMALFELLGVAQGDAFKQIIKIVK
jgi:nicotinamidase-related amidase